MEKTEVLRKDEGDRREMRGGEDREGEPMRSGLRARNAFRLRCVEV